MQVKFSTKLNQKEVRDLKQLSQRTRIPQSKLLEEAIHLLKAQFANDVVTPEFRRMGERIMQKHRVALQRLAQ